MLSAKVENNEFFGHYYSPSFQTVDDDVGTFLHSDYTRLTTVTMSICVGIDEIYWVTQVLSGLQRLEDYTFRQ